MMIVDLNSDSVAALKQRSRNKGVARTHDGALTKRVDKLEMQFQEVLNRLDRIDSRLDRIDSRLGKLEEKP